MFSRRKSSNRTTRSVYNTRMSRAQGSSKEVKKKSGKDATPTKELSLPNVEPVDKDRHLQCYSSILSRATNDSVGMEDLDRLQQELELLLSSVVVRTRALQAEVELINTTEESSRPRRSQVQLSKLRKRKKGGSWAGSQSETNEGSQSDEDWSDDEKESDHGDEEFCRKVGRTPRRPVIPLVPPSVVPISRNDVPNNYWAYVDLYCPEITQEDIKFLEDIINSYDRFEEEGNLSIPELGVHFSKLEIKQEDEENSLESPLKTPQNDPPQAAKAKMPGTSMQNMACGLVDSTTSPNSKTKKTKDTESGTSENRGPATLPPNADDKLLSLPSRHNSACFEDKLLLFLRKLGWLEEDIKNPDEILTDMKSCKDEISSLMSMNKSWLHSLKEKCKVQMSREEVNKKIEKINNEIVDVCHKKVMLQSRKKNLCKKEEEECWKLLKEREQLVNSLQEM